MELSWEHQKMFEHKVEVSGWRRSSGGGSGGGGGGKQVFCFLFFRARFAGDSQKFL